MIETTRLTDKAADHLGLPRGTMISYFVFDGVLDISDVRTPEGMDVSEDFMDAFDDEARIMLIDGKLTEPTS